MPENKPTATADLVAALSQLENVKGTKINPAFRSKYVPLDALLEAVKPILFAHNLALVQRLVSDDGKVGVQTAFLHSSGVEFDFGRLMVKADGLDAQKIGAAITYLRRQSIQTACGISIDLDDDGATASKSPATASQRFIPTPTPPAPWYAFLTAVEAERAHAYLVGKKLLPESAKDLAELDPATVAQIVGNKEKFLKAIR